MPRRRPCLVERPRARPEVDDLAGIEGHRHPSVAQRERAVEGERGRIRPLSLHSAEVELRGRMAAAPGFQVKLSFGVCSGVEADHAPVPAAPRVDPHQPAARKVEGRRARADHFDPRHAHREEGEPFGARGPYHEIPEASLLSGEGLEPELHQGVPRGRSPRTVGERGVPKLASRGRSQHEKDEPRISPATPQT